MDRIWTTEREGIIRIKVEDEEREDQCVAVLVRTKAEFLRNAYEAKTMNFCC
jgi:predicted DNA-binding protein